MSLSLSSLTRIFSLEDIAPSGTRQRRLVILVAVVLVGFVTLLSFDQMVQRESHDFYGAWRQMSSLEKQERALERTISKKGLSGADARDAVEHAAQEIDTRIDEIEIHLSEHPGEHSEKLVPLVAEYRRVHGERNAAIQRLMSRSMALADSETVLSSLLADALLVVEDGGQGQALTRNIAGLAIVLRRLSQNEPAATFEDLSNQLQILKQVASTAPQQYRSLIDKLDRQVTLVVDNAGSFDAIVWQIQQSQAPNMVAQSLAIFETENEQQLTYARRFSDALFALTLVLLVGTGYAIFAINRAASALRVSNDTLEARVHTRVAELDEAEQRHGAVVNTVADGIITIDEEGIVETFNPAAEKLFGYAKEEMTGQNVRRLMPEAFQRHLDAYLDGYLRLGEAEGSAASADVVGVRKDGVEIPLDFSISGMTVDGKTMFTGVLRDMTERKEAEHQLAEREQSLREWMQELEDAEQRHGAVVNTVVDGIITIDEGGVIETFNPAAEKLFGYTKEEAVGQNIKVLMLEEDRQQHDGHISEYLKNGKPRFMGAGREVTGLRKDGSSFPLEASVSQMRVGDRRMFTGIMRDITERKQAEEQIAEREEMLKIRVQELEETRFRLEENSAELVALAEDLNVARNAAEGANSAKTEFLATMSHEIRTPMNAIIGMTDLLLETPVSDRQRNLATTVLSSAETLLDIINQVLDFSKIEAGQLTVDATSFDLDAVLEDVIDVLSVKTHDKPVDLLLRHVPGTPRFVIGDQGRIRQILYNLVGNALKFTAEGHIQVTVESVAEADQEDSCDMIRLSVEDTGIGIEQDKLDTVFERFAQADASTTRIYGGTGLGLSICMQLADLMGGRIGVESEVGKGSKFWIEIPLPEDGAAVADEPDLAALAGLKVLIVDDLEVNRRLLDEQLSSLGMLCTCCDGGEDALDALRAADAEDAPFQLAILDYQMPCMNGREVAQAIVDDSEVSSLPMMILSSASEAVDSAAFLKAGVNSVLEKPVRRARLFMTVAALVAAFERGETSEMVGAGGANQKSGSGDDGRLFEGVRILLAEDNRINREYANEILTSMGCELVFAANGVEAVVMARSKPVDLIFMDCQMPEMDGFEASRIIKEGMAAGEVAPAPILALTANAMQGDRERCIAAGMDDYLTKPIRRKVLSDAIEMWLHKAPNLEVAEPEASPEAAGRAPLVEPVPEKTEEPPAEQTPKSSEPQVQPAPKTERERKADTGQDSSAKLDELGPDNEENAMLLDKEAMEDVKAAMKDKFGMMVEFYLDDAKTYIQEIEAAISESDVEKIVAPAHTLKSSSRQLGVVQVADYAMELEERAREVEEGAAVGDLDIAGLFKRLQDAFSDAEPELREILEEHAA